MIPLTQCLKSVTRFFEKKTRKGILFEATEYGTIAIASEETDLIECE